MFESSFIINNLAGLLVITSLLVVVSKKPTTSAWLYAVQSAVLVLSFMALGKLMNAPELYTWAATAVVTKVILVPWIMYRALGQLHDPESEGMVISPAAVVGISVVILLICHFVVSTVEVPIIVQHGLGPVLAVSLGHFMIGVLCIVVQRSILKQVFGYCLMENGAHMTLALLANRAPHLVEIGITTDAIFAVIIMVYMVRRIFTTMNTLSAQDLTALKG